MKRSTISFLADGNLLKRKILFLSNEFKRFSLLDGKGFSSLNEKSDSRICITGLGCVDEIISEKENSFEKLEKFTSEKMDWLFGFLSYDLKNEIENLVSENQDKIQLPQLHFFQPEFVFDIRKSETFIHYFENEKSNVERLIEKLNALSDFEINTPITSFESQCHCRFQKEEYLETVSEIKKHIQRGDVYELNFCMEFFAENISILPTEIFSPLCEKTQMPFSCYYHFDDKFLLSFSPERFIRKENDRIFSQPMKGTIRKGMNEKENEELKSQLKNDKKERAENVMIVDLVRNDLSKIAKPSTVNVDELCEVYSFPKVNQMISSVSAKVKDGISFAEIIKAMFPMGSMTGAPKVRAMELIEKFEKTKRGLFSGSVGYIDPEGNFDFNVVIRSILYNEPKKYLSFSAGSAITFHSDPKKEYEECLLKANLFFETLEQKISA